MSYIRAKADALGFDARGGIVERAERFIILGLGLLFSPLLLIALAVIVVLNVITAGQRFVKVWNQATVADPGAQRSPSLPPARRAARPASQRWQDRSDRLARQRTARKQR